MQSKANLCLPARLPLLFAALSLMLSACQQQHSKNTENDSEIIVAAAANLTDAFEELGPQFTQQTGIRVVFSFGSTADLAKQIENGAPFDVFAAADAAHVDTLEKEGLLTPGTRALYARGSLVVWIPSEATLTLTGSRISLARKSSALPLPSRTLRLTERQPWKLFGR